MGTRDCKHVSSVSTPTVGEAGRTGDWRTVRPHFDPTKCLAVKAARPVCMQCWAYCPEGCFEKEVASAINLEYCKGCGICAEVCPADAITMVAEHALEEV